MIRITTDRLNISQLTLDDTSFILDLVNTPSWITHIGDRNIHSKEDAEKYLLQGPMLSYKQFRFGLLRLALHEPDTPIGICGLLKREELEYPDLGFALLPEFEGAGYGYESSVAVLGWARKELGMQTILAITSHQNTRSQHLLTKLGFQLEQTEDTQLRFSISLS